MQGVKRHRRWAIWWLAATVALFAQAICVGLLFAASAAGR